MVDHNIGVGDVLYRLWGNNFDFLRMIVGVKRIDTCHILTNDADGMDVVYYMFSPGQPIFVPKKFQS